MISGLPGTAHVWAVVRWCVVAGLALSVGCAGYERKPLLADEFQRMLEGRTPDGAGVVEGIARNVYTPGDGLLLQEAELLSLYLNPRVRWARAEAQVFAASARYAGLWDDPEVAADVLRILEDVEEPWIAGASLSFTVPVSGRLAVAKAQARAEARAAVVEAWTVEQTVLLDLREAWADWEAAAESLQVSRRMEADLRGLVKLTDHRAEVGEMIAAEAVAFRLAEARLSLDVERLEAEEAQARLDVLELLGLLPGADVVLVPGGEDSDAPTVSPDSIHARSPQVLLAAARYEAAEERLRLEVRKQYPDITLGPLFGNEEGMDRLGVGVSVPIPILNANRGGIAEASAARDAARAAWELAVQEGTAELARSETALGAAQRRVYTLERSVVPLATLQIEEARRLAELGELDTLLVLEALHAEREAALDLIAAKRDVRAAVARVRRAIPDEVPSFSISEKETE